MLDRQLRPRLPESVAHWLTPLCRRAMRRRLTSGRTDLTAGDGSELPVPAVARSWLRTGGLVLALCALGLAVAAVREALSVRASGVAIRLEPCVQSIGEVRGGSTTPVSFFVTNSSARSVRILGVESMCTPAVCALFKGGPAEILPGGRHEVRMELTANARFPGTFAGTTNLYTDSQPECRVPLTIEGEVVCDR